MPSAGTGGAAAWAWASWGAGALAYLGGLAWALVVLPERVVAHIGTEGVDRWGNRTEHAVLSLVLAAVILPMPWLFRAAARPPGTWLNLPHKDYWLATPERVAILRRRLFEDGLVFTGATAVFMAVGLQLAVVRATNDPTSGEGSLLVIGLAVYLALVGVWLAVVRRRYRPPGPEGG